LKVLSSQVEAAGESAFSVLTEGLQEPALANTVGGVEPEDSSGNLAY
jgi:hypothetical protein